MNRCREWTKGSSLGHVQVHRIHGPAIEKNDGTKIWVIEGTEMRRETNWSFEGRVFANSAERTQRGMDRSIDNLMYELATLSEKVERLERRLRDNV